jgi:hypothetical protein
MGKNFLLIVLLCLLTITITNAQEPLSFFPHNVGDRWDYAYWNGGFYTYYSKVITRDSLTFDGNLYLFYNNYPEPEYIIDTSENVFWILFNCNSLMYKLRSDSGDVWENPSCGERWGWVASIDSGTVFSQSTTIKVFQYGPVHPDSVPEPYVLRERWLASGFGLIYEWQEPGYFSFLEGCVIEGDTFGIITSVESVKDEVPAEFLLKQNYPNPFNPSTTIEFILPQEAEINLSIYDILGRKVAVLYEGLKGSGSYKYQWNARDISSGIYFCRLSANGNVRTIKMLLAK